MPLEPILTLGELEPERQLVGIHRKTPDGAWQRFKRRHFGALLTWFPVRYQRVYELYPLRTPQEFGFATIAKIERYRTEYAALQGRESEAGPAEIQRASQVMRDITAMILDAPAEVIDELPDGQRIRLLLAFPAAVAARTPTQPGAENPPTSGSSSPASAASTAPTTG